MNAGQLQITTCDISLGDVDASAKRFEERLLHFIHLCILHNTIPEDKSAHEWIGDGCRRLIRETRSAWDIAFFAEKSDACAFWVDECL